LQSGIQRKRPSLDAGQPIEIILYPGGYVGKWEIDIKSDDQEHFEVLGSMRDPGRFPQRIRVAALALLREDAFGRFVIEHDRDQGIVTIQRSR
jgi:hypothetical protein